MDVIKTISDKGMSSLGKMIEFRHFTLVWSILFSLDIFCILIYNQNLIDLFNSSNEKSFEIIYFFLFIAFFTFFMTLFFPTLRYLIRTIILLMIHDTNNEKGKDYKYLFSVKKTALQNKDSFLLSLVEKKESENKEFEIDLNISFALGLLTFFDYLIGTNIQSISNYFINLSEQLSGILYIIYLLIITVFIVIMGFWFYMSLQPYQIEEIYLPENDEISNNTLEEK